MKFDTKLCETTHPTLGYTTLGNYKFKFSADVEENAKQSAFFHRL